MSSTPTAEPARRRSPMDVNAALPAVVGDSAPLRDTLSRGRAAVRRRPRLLILAGESGTGKTLLARALHHASPVRSGPLLVLPCAALPGDQAVTELLGDGESGRPGLLELARGGTLLLEDAHLMSPELVRALLQAWAEADLASGRPDLRRAPGRFPVVMATASVTAALPASPGQAGPSGDTPPTPEAVGALPLQRLRMQTGAGALLLPPLRDRKGDIGRLARHFLEEWARERRGSVPRMESPARIALEAHSWPGNVRELRAVVRQAAEVAPGDLIREEHVKVRTRRTEGIRSEGPAAPEMILIPARGKTWAEIEAEAVQATLRITEGNRSQAARILGVSRPTLTRKIRKYGLDVPGED
ncbi:MAG: sigma-54-dependent Fis family transcriptional regulator [Gemmatimonadales bacterium]|nr:MAG: sigma-54-dependent Fis family transcriptional regulator [Gemmatimonadales bacterium]